MLSAIQNKKNLAVYFYSKTRDHLKKTRSVSGLSEEKLLVEYVYVTEKEA